MAAVHAPRRSSAVAEGESQKRDRVRRNALHAQAVCVLHNACIQVPTLGQAAGCGLWSVQGQRRARKRVQHGLDVHEHGVAEHALLVDGAQKLDTVCQHTRVVALQAHVFDCEHERQNVGRACEVALVVACDQPEHHEHDGGRPPQCGVHAPEDLHSRTHGVRVRASALRDFVAAACAGAKAVCVPAASAQSVLAACGAAS